MKTSTLTKLFRNSPGVAMAALCALLGTPGAEAQVQCVDTNGVKYLQPPNLDGYDISDSLGYVMADDFVCTNTGPVSDIHIWGSWLNDQHGIITNFWLGIYSDVPATTNASSGTVTPSHPGGLLWSQAFPTGQFAESEVGSSQEHFISPASVNIIGPDTQVWYYCFTPTNPFIQTGNATAPKVYWLAAYAQGQKFGPQYDQAPQYGWKTTPTVQNDVSVFTFWPGALPGSTATWNENTTPANSPIGAQPLDLAFELTTATNSQPSCCPEGNTKYVQPPNLQNGIDLDARDIRGGTLADDFRCITTGPITDIHVWGSWLSDEFDFNASFTLSIWSDVPATPANGAPSHPGAILWTQTFGPQDYNYCPYASVPEPFDDPNYNAPIPPVLNFGASTNLYYLCFYPTNPFVQTGTPNAPTNFWLSLTETDPQATGPFYFGWKTSALHYNDPAVYTLHPATPAWNSFVTATGSNFDLAFQINTETNVTTPGCNDTNAVKFYQPPQTAPQQGFNVRDSRDAIALADDFLCTRTGPVSGIHVWGSWLNDLHGSVSNFWIGIYNDVPAVILPGTTQVLANSHPGALLWYQNFGATSGQFTESYYTNAIEYFYNPTNNQIIGQDTQVYQYCFFPTNPFVQQGTPNAPTNYWLAIRAQVYDTNTAVIYGWKSSAVPYNDPAVWGTFVGGFPNGTWQSMTNPLTGQQFDLSMLLTTMTTTNCTPTVRCVGDKTVYCSAGTTWSFDGPVVIDPCCSTLPTITTNIVTNSITACSQSYTANFTITDCNGIIGSGCQQTVTVLDTNAPIFINCMPSETVACGSSWAFNVPVAQYVCSGLNAPVGILSSNVTMQAPCLDVYTVDWSATNQCNGAVAYCQEQVVVKDTNAPVISCGTNFTVEWPDSWTFTPPTAVYACSGVSVPVNILSSNVDRTQCGTTNTIVWSAINQCNDAMATCTQVVTVVCPCQETNGIIKYTQPPNTTQGYDVWNSTTLPPNTDDGTWLLADDFVCTNTGYITDLHIWGSWLNNAVALNDITFWLGLFSDDPATTNNLYSTPASLIWSQCFAPGEYSENFWSPSTESFLDPGPPSILGSDNVAWYYCFYPTNPPIQHGSTLSHKTYWLAVYAQLPAGVTNYFGWKTTAKVQNDISVHAKWVFGACPSTINPARLAWSPTRTVTGAPLDLAFQISTATNCAATFLTIDPTTNNQVIVQWPSGVLQGATNVLGPYVDMPAAVSPYTTPEFPLPPTNRFFRVRCN